MSITQERLEKLRKRIESQYDEIIFDQDGDGSIEAARLSAKLELLDYLLWEARQEIKNDEDILLKFSA